MELSTQKSESLEGFLARKLPLDVNPFRAGTTSLQPGDFFGHHENRLACHLHFRPDSYHLCLCASVRLQASRLQHRLSDGARHRPLNYRACGRHCFGRTTEPTRDVRDCLDFDRHCASCS